MGQSRDFHGTIHMKMSEKTGACLPAWVYRQASRMRLFMK